MIKKLMILIIVFLLLVSCQDNIKGPSVYISVLSKPSEAKVYTYITSKVDDVKKTKRVLLGRTPYRRAILLDIEGLSSSNAHNVTMVLEIVKKGYYKRVEKIDLNQILNTREVRLMYHLTKKGSTEEDEESEPFTVPLPPKNVKASDGEHKDYVKITWDKVSDAQKYYVFRDTSNDGEFKSKIALVKDEKFFDSTAEPEKVYYYKVQAYNKLGKSKLSNSDSGFRKKKAKEDEESKDNSGSSSSEAGIPTPKVGNGGAPAAVPTAVPFSKSGKKGAKSIIKNISG